jgi:hypothetical protein
VKHAFGIRPFLFRLRCRPRSTRRDSLNCRSVVLRRHGSSPASAQAASAYPTRPVRSSWSLLPRSSTTCCRYTGSKLAGAAGNRPFGSETGRRQQHHRRRADGEGAARRPHVLLVSTSHTMNAGVYKLPFDPVKSFSAVRHAGHRPLVRWSRARSPPPASRTDRCWLPRSRSPRVCVRRRGGINHFGGALSRASPAVQLVHVPVQGRAHPR